MKIIIIIIRTIRQQSPIILNHPTEDSTSTSYYEWNIDTGILCYLENLRSMIYRSTIFFSARKISACNIKINIWGWESMQHKWQEIYYKYHSNVSRYKEKLKQKNKFRSRKQNMKYQYKQLEVNYAAKYNMHAIFHITHTFTSWIYPTMLVNSNVTVDLLVYVFHNKLLTGANCNISVNPISPSPQSSMYMCLIKHMKCYKPQN